MFDQMSSQQVRETPIPRKPEIALLVPRDGIDFFAGYGIYGNKPAAVEIGKSALGGRPDSPTIVLIETLHRIIEQSVCATEDCTLPIPPPRQTIMSANPHAPIGGCDHGKSS